MDISRALLELNPDGVLGIDPEYRYTLWNPAMERISGLSRETVLGRDVFELFPFLKEIGEDRHFAAALAGEVSISRDRPYRIGQTGHVGFFDGHYQPLRDETGRITGVLGLIRDVTVRHQAESKARENRELFESYMSHIPGVAFMKDSEGRHVYANRAFEETHGLRPREWEGKLDAEIFPPDTAARFRAHDMEVLEAGVPLRMVDTQGARAEPEHWMWIKFPFSDAAGRRFVAGLAFNITDQHRAEQALRASEERFRQLTENLHEVFYIANLAEERVEYVSPAYETIWGRSARALYGDARRFLDVVHPEDRPRVSAMFVRQFPDQPVTDEYRVFWPDGTIRHVMDRRVPLPDPEGRTVRVVGIVTDVTDRVEIERERQYMQTISDVALANLGLHDVPAIAARSLKEILNVDVAAVLTKTEGGSFAVQASPGAADLVGVHVTTSDGATSLLANAGFSGRRAVPLEIGGRPIGLLVVGRRSGGLSPDEGRLLLTLADRMALVIAHAQLFAELQQASRRKDEFLATLGHELRNPLAPLLTAAELMRAHPATDPVLLGAQEVVIRQSHHMRRLIDDLLDVARITRGIVSLHLDRLDLRDAVREAIQTARPLIDAREHELFVSMPGEPLYVDADKVRLEQVITNLLSNASKFTPRGGRIDVRVERTGEAAAFTVADTGKGIPRDMLSRVFDLFTQVNPSLDRAEGGLGLGLTLVKRLVDMHGGSVTAASAGAGLGTEFVVQLPSRPPPETPAPSAEAEPEVRATECRVLIVDDNVDSAEMLKLVLPAWGYQAATAYSGPAALEQADRFEPHIILLDIGLPGMNGYEVARQLQGSAQHQQVPLVAVTGYGQDDDRRRTREAGFAAHLTKPVDLDVLRGVLESLRPHLNHDSGQC